MLKMEGWAEERPLQELSISQSLEIVKRLKNLRKLLIVFFILLSYHHKQD